jgi:hypothetical protein
MAFSLQTFTSVAVLTDKGGAEKISSAPDIE